jgi:hypothetical protein
MVVKPESAIGAKGAIQTMKNKQFTVAELQEAINNRLSGHAGRELRSMKARNFIRGLTERLPQSLRKEGSRSFARPCGA